MVAQEMTEQEIIIGDVAEEMKGGGDSDAT